MGFFGDLFGGKQGQDAGNQMNLSAEDQLKAKKAGSNFLGYQGSADALDPLQSSRTATNEVQNNAMLGQLFGKNGTLGRTVGEEERLANSGYALQPQDKEAYGQASDNIAREFGMSDNNLSQALQSRGLGASSAMAGQAFAGAQGNKMEQLAGMQRQIANDRMKSNMERLGQTRNFLQGLSSQAGNELQNQYGRQMGSEQARFGELQGQANFGQGQLSDAQNQANNQFSQRQATQQGGLGSQLIGGLGAAVHAAPMAALNAGMSGMSGAPSGAMSSGGGGGSMPTSSSFQQPALGSSYKRTT